MSASSSEKANFPLDGCVESRSQLGSSNFLHQIYLPNRETCVKYAKEVQTCGPKDANGMPTKGKCHFIAYRNLSKDDVLADMKDDCTKLLRHWTKHMPVSEKKAEIAHLQANPGKKREFMSGYAGACSVDPVIFAQFQHTANDKPTGKIADYGGDCWLGGASAEHVEPKKGRPCPYEVYQVTGIDPTAEDYTVEFQQARLRRLKKAKEDLKIAEKKAETAHANYMASMANVPPSQYPAVKEKVLKGLQMKKASAAAQKKLDEANKEYTQARQKAAMLNAFATTSSGALKITADQVGQKKASLMKMNADISNLNWSIEESERKARLTNKIMAALGIIIMLFVGLCAALLFYYLIKGQGILGTGMRPGNAASRGVSGNILDNVLGLKPPKGGPPGASKNIFDNIF